MESIFLLNNFQTNPTPFESLLGLLHIKEVEHIGIQFPDGLKKGELMMGALLCVHPKLGHKGNMEVICTPSFHITSKYVCFVY